VNPALRARLDSLAARLEELNRLLAAEDATRNMDQFRKLSREHSELAALVGLYDRFRQAERDAQEAKDLAADAAMKGYAEEELKRARAAMEKFEAQLHKQLLPKDPNDDRNIFLEVRAGTGGDESAAISFAAAASRSACR